MISPHFNLRIHLENEHYFLQKFLVYLNKNKTLIDIATISSVTILFIGFNFSSLNIFMLMVNMWCRLF